SSRRRHTRFSRDWSSDVCSSDLGLPVVAHRTRLTEDFIPRLVPGCVFDPRVESLVESLAQVASLEPELVTAAAERRAEELAPSRSEERRVGRDSRSRRPPLSSSL